MPTLDTDNRSCDRSRRPCAFVVGDVERLEFRRFRELLEQSLDLIRCDDVQDALRCAEGAGRFPHVVFFVQAYPGQWPDFRINAFQRAFPTARFVQILGSWCEGERRTGDPIPGVFRFYWHQWTPALCRELENLAEGRRSFWSSPPTAAQEELAEAAACRPLKKGEGLVLIESENPEMKAMLRDACREIGYTPVPRADYDDPILSRVVVEVDEVTDELRADLNRKIATASPKTKFVVAAGFPRVQDVEDLIAAGVAAVLSKPFDVAELADVLNGEPCEEARSR